jgi:hypothetical protein
MSNDELVAETEKRKNIEAVVKEFEQYVQSKDPTLLPTIFVMYKASIPLRRSRRTFSNNSTAQ